MRFVMEFPMFSISMSQEANFLSEVTIDRLYSALALTVINCYLNIHNLIWKVQYLRNLSLNAKINSRLQTTKTTLILQLALKLKVLLCKSLDTLLLDILHFKLTLFLIELCFLLLDIGNSLALQHLLGFLAHLFNLFIHNV